MQTAGARAAAAAGAGGHTKAIVFLSKQVRCNGWYTKNIARAEARASTDGGKHKPIQKHT